MPNFSLDSQAQDALSHLQDTSLTPMEEALFQAWTKANAISKPDDPKDHVDYRGIYKASGGSVLPNGQLARFSEKLNSEDKLQDLLHERLMKHIDTLTQKHMAVNPPQENTEPKHGPGEHQSFKLQNEGASIENKGIQAATEGTHAENQGKQLDNQGKQLDIQRMLVQREIDKNKPKESGNAGQ